MNIPNHNPPYCTINKYMITKWKLAAWSIQGLPSSFEIMPPSLGRHCNPAMNPHTKENRQAPITLKNINEERTIGRVRGEAKMGERTS